MNTILNIKYKLIIVISTIVLGISSCTEVIELDLKDTSAQLVVDGVISTDTTRYHVRLTRSGSYFDNEEAEAVSNASVSIDDGFKTINLNESDTYPGYYLTPQDYYGVPGRTYHLTIENVDINEDGVSETYEAESGMNTVTSIDSVSLKYHDIWELWEVLLYAQDPADTKDFYAFSVYQNEELISNRYSELGFVDDKFFDGNYAGGVWVQTIDEEDEELVLNDGDWIKLRMMGITEEFYEFLEAVSTETGYSSPLFSGIPANVPSNVSNGALGFFTAYSYSIDSVQFFRAEY